MNGSRGVQRVCFPASIKKEGQSKPNVAAVPLQSVATSSFRAVLGTTDKARFVSETGLGPTATSHGVKRARPDSPDSSQGGVLRLGTGPVPTVPENEFDMPTERGVTACIPYNHSGARPAGTSLFLHGRIEDTRVFGRAPHLRYLDMEEGVRLPACIKEKIAKVVCATSQKFDQYERKQPVRPDVCFYDTYEIPIADEVVRCPVDFNGKTMTVSGTFCSEACVLAYIRDGRAGPRAQQHGATWLTAMRRWRDCLGPPVVPKDDFIDAALHYTVLDRFGGPMNIEEYRDRGKPRSSYRRHITYVFPEHFRIVPSGYIHIREDRAQPPQQHTVRAVAITSSARPAAPPPFQFQNLNTPTQTPAPVVSHQWWSTTPAVAVGPAGPATPASPFALGAAAAGVGPAGPATPNFVSGAVSVSKRRRLRRIETSDDEKDVVPGARSTSQTSPRNDYYRIRRIEQAQLGRRKRHYQSGDADIHYQRKAASRRRKKAVGKQASEPQGLLKEFFGAADGFSLGGRE